MVNLVIVSHSRKLAEGVCDVARQMASDAMLILAVGGIADAAAAGDDHIALGTEAPAIAQAICDAMGSDGVLVLIDMGSAAFAAEAALQTLPKEMRSRVLISNAPLVEGAIVAAVEASLGRSLQEVNAAAEAAAQMLKR